MLTIPQGLLDQITRAAEDAFPHECCGLLAGRELTDGEPVITRVVPSANVAETNHEDSFEVDPQVRFDLMRALDGSEERIIGHYHSHPGGPANPSATDLSMAYETDLIWVIVSVKDGKAVDTRAHGVAPDRSAFHPIPLNITAD
ncbi:MAG: M67 family metallopeptidase [Rhodospirillales bacterium]